MGFNSAFKGLRVFFFHSWSNPVYLRNREVQNGKNRKRMYKNGYLFRPFRKKKAELKGWAMPKSIFATARDFQTKLSLTELWYTAPYIHVKRNTQIKNQMTENIGFTHSFEKK